MILLLFLFICFLSAALLYYGYNKKETLVIFNKNFKNDKIINEEVYKQWSPSLEFDNDYMKDSILSKDDKVLENYFAINYLYRKAFEEYIYIELDFEKFNEKLIQNKDDDLKNTTIYQKYSTLEDSPIYLRSYPYIERLNDKDLLLLNQRVEDKNYVLDKEIMEVIERTYMEVCVYSVTGTERYERTGNSFGIVNKSGNKNSVGSPINVDKDSLWIVVPEIGYDYQISDSIREELQILADEKLSCKVNIISDIRKSNSSY